MNYVRTAILLAGLTALFMAVGGLIGGQSGAMIALVVAAGMNLLAYWNSDKLVLSMHGAQEVDTATAPDLVRLAQDLAQRAGLPMPRVFIMDNPQPNAFATGRNPENAAVAVTTGLWRMLPREEVAGVIAHELAHIKNRDTLTMTITATIAGAISMLAQFGMFFGGHRDNNSGLGVIGTIAMVILAPIAAMLVQMAISRTREYAADNLGARICGRPDALEPMGQRIADAREALVTEAEDVFQPAVMRGRLQVFERLDAEVVIGALGERAADARHRGEQACRVALAPQAFEHGEAAAREQVADGARDARSDGWQRLETFYAALGQDV